MRRASLSQPKFSVEGSRLSSSCFCGTIWNPAFANQIHEQCVGQDEDQPQSAETIGAVVEAVNCVYAANISNQIQPRPVKVSTGVPGIIQV